MRPAAGIAPSKVCNPLPAVAGLRTPPNCGNSHHVVFDLESVVFSGGPRGHAVERDVRIGEVVDCGDLSVAQDGLKAERPIPYSN